MHTSYYKIVKQSKSFTIVIVAPTCFGIHKPSSVKYSMRFAKVIILIAILYKSLFKCSVIWLHTSFSPVVRVYYAQCHTRPKINSHNTEYFSNDLYNVINTNAQQYAAIILNISPMCVTYLNNGWPTRWHLLYYILLNMFQTLIRPSSGASEYLLCCVGCTTSTR